MQQLLVCIGTLVCMFLCSYSIASARWTSPQLDADVAQLHADVEAKAAVSLLKEKFCHSAEALSHGDLHTGVLKPLHYGWIFVVLGSGFKPLPCAFVSAAFIARVRSLPCVYSSALADIIFLGLVVQAASWSLLPAAR